MMRNASAIAGDQPRELQVRARQCGDEAVAPVAVVVEAAAGAEEDRR